MTALLLPGVSVLNVIPAMELVAVFGAFNASLRPFVDYGELPANAYMIGLFAIVVNGGLVFCTSAVVPGFFVHGFMVAGIMILILAILNTSIALYVHRGWLVCVEKAISNGYHFFRMYYAQVRRFGISTRSRNNSVS